MHQDYTRIVREVVAWRLQPPDNGEPPQRRNVNGTMRHTLLVDLAAASERYAILKGVSADDFDETVLAPAFNVVDGIQSGLTDYSSRSKPIDHYDFWKHHNDPIALIEAKQHPYMNRQALEETVGEYLRQPVRSDVLDRLIADVLIAMEVFAFADEMLNKPHIGTPSVGNLLGLYPPPLKVSFWLERTKQFFRFTGIYIALSFLIIGACWLFGLSLLSPSLVLAAIYVFIAMVGVIESPFSYLRFRKSRSSILETASASVRVYNQLLGQGVASAKRVREAAVEAEGKGVVWPPSLYALLDDSIARGSKLRNW